MSNSHTSDEIVLPDDAEQKLNELLEELRQSELRVKGESSPQGDAPLPAAEVDTPPASVSQGVSTEEDFLSDEESDFVDLDAELLDNSADMLRLDEEAFPSEREASPEPDEQSEQSEPDAPDDSPLKPQLATVRQGSRVDTDERDADPFAELEPTLHDGPVTPLEVPSPVASPSVSLPGWLLALLVLLALALSGAALWSSQTASPVTTQSTSPGDEAVQVKALRGEIALLRERLDSVERRAVAAEEAVSMIEGMQATLARMEQRLLKRDSASDSASDSVDDSSAKSVADLPLSASEPTPLPEAAEPEASTLVAVAATDEAQTSAGAVVTTSTGAGKVFIKGWAVNLRSYFYKVDAERLLRSYQRQGIDAEIREISKGNATWYRVRVMGFASKSAAQAFIEKLTPEQGREGAWPSYYKGFVEG